jgi:glycosyltransferase involved in cell wall biosynthesis
MKLILINYSMSSKSLLFSHQREIALALSSHFDHTFVITGEEGIDLNPKNISIFNTNWTAGKNLRNVIRFYLVTVPLIFKYRKDAIVLCHMTDVQASLISGVCKFLRMRSYLWYAHKSPSIYLRFSALFLTRIFTSTPGSCPLKGRKVHPIGQAVKSFSSIPREMQINETPLSWYHIGRLDPSKRIEDIVLALENFRKEFPDISLHIYGRASSLETEEYAIQLMNRFSTNKYTDWVIFHGPISNSSLSEISIKHDGFIHAFQGSLDKTLVEAAMLKRIIVSANPEFSLEFEGVKQAPEQEVSSILESKLEEVFKQDQDYKLQVLERNYKIAVQRHSMESWVRNFTSQVLVAKK